MISKKYLLLAVVTIFALPFWYSGRQSTNPNTSAPFIPTAYGGHATPGNFWCQCGCPDCICDPGEVATECSEARLARPINGEAKIPTTSPSGASRGRDFDFGSSVLLTVLVLIMMRRILI